MVQKKTNVDQLVKGLNLAGSAAAAIVGGYFFYGKDGAKHRKHLKTWSVKAKAEVLEKIEKAKDISEEVYHQSIDAVSEKYAKVKTVTPEDLEAFKVTLKKHWKDIKREIAPAPAKKSVKKAAKKA